MSSFRKPPELNLNDPSLANAWRIWKQDWQFFYDANELERKPDKVKIGIFFNCAGLSAQERFSHFEWENEGDASKLDKIIEQFDKFCIPRENPIVERYNFHKRAQQTGETVLQYVSALRTLAATCKFGLNQDEMIRDRLCMGLSDTSTVMQLLKHADLTLAKAIEIATLEEAALKDQQLLAGKEAEVCAVQHYRGARPKRHTGAGSNNQHRRSQDHEQKPCGRCGFKTHTGTQCPASGKVCKKCNKKGHFATMCRSKAIEEVDMYQEVSQEEYFLGEVKTPSPKAKKNRGKPWVVTLDINTKPVQFKIDTGADISVMSEATWQDINKPQLTKSQVCLTSPGGGLDCLGEFTTHTTWKGKQYSFRVAVIKGTMTKSLLSRDAAVDMGLVARIDAVSSQAAVGLMKTSPVRINLKQDAVPFCLFTARNVPFPLMDVVKKELDKMVDSKVIRRVTEPTEWCAPMVPVPKPKGGVRICVDLQRLNKAVKREHLVLPTLDDVAPNLAGSTIFSSLDAESGFWQIPLEPESQKLTTFISPFGRFCFERLPFGITSASEIFQRKMLELLQDHEGVEVIIDDILVHGRTREEHDARLKRVLETVSKSGLKLNYQKCQFRKRELIYFGHVIGVDGIKPAPEKVRALEDMPAPKNLDDLRRILGTMNYLGRFVPNMSTLAKPMSDLLKADTTWDWGPHQEQAFRRCKDILTRAPNLQYYNVSLPTVVSADASSYGLGAVLQQEHDGVLKPVAFCSRTLTEAEQRYAQIEKECLAAVWACEKFERYLVGLQNFTLQTDHKPLVPLMSTKPLHQAPVRCQRLLLRMLRFNFEVQHVPGKDLIVPDTLSRSPLTLTGTDSDRSRALVEEVEAHIDALQASWPASRAKLQDLKEATKNDDDLQRVATYVADGWPRSRSAVPAHLAPYAKVQGDLSTCDGLVTFQDRIVVPATCRAEILQRLHGSHQGLVSCRARARESVWWPGIGQHLKDLVLNCEHCRLHRPSQRHEPLKPTELPDRPWAKLAADLCELNGRQFLILVDYYSRWLEIKELRSTTSTAVSNSLMAIFATHGFPDELRTDNGPQFTAQSFKDFATRCGFTHTTSSPHFHQSNGLAERAVQTAKRILKLQDPLQGLMDYRATPNSTTGVSPAVALMSRSLKTRVPVLKGRLQPKSPDRVQLRARDNAAKAAQKREYDRRHGAHELPTVGEGARVLIRTDEQSDWRRRGVITGLQPSGRSYTVTTPTGVLRRNRRHILPAAPAAPTSNTFQNIPGQPEQDVAASEPTPPQDAPAPTAGPQTQLDRQSATPPTREHPQRTRREPPHLKDYVR